MRTSMLITGLVVAAFQSTAFAEQTVYGKPFKAVSAIAKRAKSDEAGQREITIFEVPMTCKIESDSELKREKTKGHAATASMKVVWKKGKLTDETLLEASFAWSEGNSGKFRRATSSAGELLDAPAKAGGKGKLSFKLSNAEGDSVEGQVAVEVCPEEE